MKRFCLGIIVAIGLTLPAFAFDGRYSPAYDTLAGDHFWQATVGHRAFIEISADEGNAAGSQRIRGLAGGLCWSALSGRRHFGEG
jgi:hypothetical protein